MEFFTSLQKLYQEEVVDLSNFAKPETLDFISAFYDSVDHYKEKEAAGNIVLIPFLGQVSCDGSAEKIRVSIFRLLVCHIIMVK